MHQKCIFFISDTDTGAMKIGAERAGRERGGLEQCPHSKKRHTNWCVPFFCFQPKAVFLDGLQRGTAAVALARMKFDYFG